MAFIDQGEFETMKMLDERRAPRCDKHQFRAKMTVSTQAVVEISLLNVVACLKKKMSLLLPHTFTFSCLLRGFWVTI